MTTETDSWAPSKDAWDALLQSNADLATRLDNQAEEVDQMRRVMMAMPPRLRDLELHKAQSYIQTQTLNEQVAALVETQKRDETDRYIELRRALLVIGLTELLRETWEDIGPEDLDESEEYITERQWKMLCADLHRRYDHLQFDGKPLWAGPPKAPSPETRALIAESLRRRQEA